MGSVATNGRSSTRFSDSGKHRQSDRTASQLAEEGRLERRRTQRQKCHRSRRIPRRDGSGLIPTILRQLFRDRGEFSLEARPNFSCRKAVFICLSAPK